MSPGSRIAVDIPRSALLYAAILAVLKAGCAYVALNAGDPAARREFIVSDSQAAAVLELDDGTVSVRKRAVEESVGRPGDLAYVVYTSGTTGRPKGVPIRHDDVLALLRSAERHFAIGPDDVWPLMHSCAFDMSVWEIWGALGFGGTAVVIREESARNAYQVAAALQRHGITILSQVPTAFHALATAVRRRPVDLSSVRLVVLGGERARSHDVLAWTASGVAPACRVANMYGISEGTVHSTVADVTDASILDDGSGGTLIGVPLPHQRMRILGSDLQPAPIGTVGEISLSGAGVTRGYLNRPGLQQERFLSEPGGDIWFRTGDLGYFDGSNYWYRGRRDDQVKIRGFRVELGEIEAAIRTSSLTDDCVVFLAETGPDRSQLAALVVLSPEVVRSRDDAVAELRKHLESVLPPYMIPPSFVAVGRIAQTAGGKHDRRAAEKVWRDGGGSRRE